MSYCITFYVSFFFVFHVFISLEKSVYSKFLADPFMSEDVSSEKKPTHCPRKGCVGISSEQFEGSQGDETDEMLSA